MNLSDLKPGTILKANNWKEPIEVKNIEEVGEYIRIIFPL